MEEIILNIEGMACSHCEKAVCGAVEKLSGVKKVKAQADKKRAVIKFDTALISKDRIVKAVEAAGYRVLP